MVSKLHHSQPQGRACRDAPSKASCKKQHRRDALRALNKILGEGQIMSRRRDLLRRGIEDAYALATQPLAGSKDTTCVPHDEATAIIASAFASQLVNLLGNSGATMALGAISLRIAQDLQGRELEEQLWIDIHAISQGHCVE